ncbi:MAG: SDR family oxidoreductase [Candidatus Omnitrophica bacterium]|nr:SDR family oxidoreductase [Candidatus Omnitrophota bacterium]
MRSLKELMDLKKRTAIITGAAGNVGFALAESLAELGANIVLLDINKEQGQAKAEDIKNTHKVETLFLPVDLENEKEITEVPEIVINKFGSIDILINCAALLATSGLEGWAVPFEKQKVDSWRRALEVNLTSVFLLTQGCRQYLIDSGHGSIVNIGSIYGVGGPDLRLYEGVENLGNPAAYAASKGGLLQFTRWLATVLAPSVRVNSISPGGVFRKHEDPFLSRYIERTPLKRMAKEEDLKGAVAFLASDLSLYVTGQNLMVDGGWSAW